MMKADNTFWGCYLLGCIGLCACLITGNVAPLLIGCLIMSFAIIRLIVLDIKTRKKWIESVTLEAQSRTLLSEIEEFLIRKRAEELGFHICPVCWKFNNNRDNGLPINYCEGCRAVTWDPPAASER